jgi:hypothetical protein
MGTDSRSRIDIQNGFGVSEELGYDDNEVTPWIVGAML